jgi:hypothetical protein
MADKRELEEKLDEIDKKFDPESIRKHYKARLLSRINKGEIGLLDDLAKLEELEKGKIPGVPDPSGEAIRSSLRHGIRTEASSAGS